MKTRKRLRGKPAGHHISVIHKITQRAVVFLHLPVLNFSYGTLRGGFMISFMINRKIFAPGIAAICFLFTTGCATMLTSASYSFAQPGEQTASIYFNSSKNNGISLIDYSGTLIPKPEEGTRWDLVTFPAEKRFFLKVNVYDKGKSNIGANSSGTGILDALLGIVGLVASLESSRAKVNRDVYFTCPPLEAGKQYNLIFKSRPIRRNSIELWERGASRLIYEQIL